MESPQQRQQQQQQQQQHPHPAKHCRSSGKECSMCGDVGFQKELFRCASCRQRYQHKYCSRLYPNLLADASQWTCDWCISKQPRARNHHQVAAAPASDGGLKAAGCVTATRSVQTPLDCLLQVAETLEKYSVKKQQQQQPKDGSGTAPPHSGDFVKPKLPLVHKRKRCSDLDISKQEEHPQEESRHQHQHHDQHQQQQHQDHKLKSPISGKDSENISRKESENTKPPTTSPGYSNGFQFSPSKAGVGRRYRLLSEVLC